MALKRHKLSAPSAGDLAEIARGKGSARDKAEAAAYRKKKGVKKSRFRLR